MRIAIWRRSLSGTGIAAISASVFSLMGWVFVGDAVLTIVGVMLGTVTVTVDSELCIVMVGNEIG